MARLILLGCTLLFMTGCLNTQDREERERWTDREWKAAIEENQERLKPEEERSKGLAGGIGAALGQVGTLIGDAWNYITGNTPFNAAKGLLDPASADLRRQSIVYLADREYGRDEPYTKYYVEMARTDNDPLVRAMAVRALNRSRYEEAGPVFIAALEDRDPLVRIEAAKALANVPDTSAVGPLIKHMSNPEEHIDVRVAAADALRNFRTSEAAQALVRVLRDRNFGVSWQARKSLKLMTGKDYRYDPTAWLTYLTGTETPFG